MIEMLPAQAGGWLELFSGFLAALIDWTVFDREFVAPEHSITH